MFAFIHECNLTFVIAVKLIYPIFICFITRCIMLKQSLICFESVQLGFKAHQGRFIVTRVFFTYANMLNNNFCSV